MKFALAGNPNIGKTTLFNGLTGLNQHVGNWPGVTVEKKEGRYREDETISIIDLPGIYSLSPYSLEEVVARDYLLSGEVDGIINIVDGTNLQRNLYLTSQLLELGLATVIAINMSDVMEKEGYELDTIELAKRLNAPVVKISAASGMGSEELIRAIRGVVLIKQSPKTLTYSPKIEEALGKISDKIHTDFDRWYGVKIFERDKKVLEDKSIIEDREEFEDIISRVEEAYGEDAESIIINERYGHIDKITDGIYGKRAGKRLGPSKKIDDLVLNKFFALPIFALVIFMIYYVSISTVGTAATDFVNENIFGDGWFLFGSGKEAYEEAMEDYDFNQDLIGVYEAGSRTMDIYDDEGNFEQTLAIGQDDYDKALGMDEPNPHAFGTWFPSIPAFTAGILEKLGVNDFLSSLVLDGIVAGVGAVLGFLPQMFVLFLFLAVLEGSGYMARIAFILDKVFRAFGLSGKSFIPMLVGTGCSVPGILAARTIESERERKMTIITTSFIPCSAKLPVIALISGAVLGGKWWVAPSAYFLGIGAVMVSGLILKKMPAFEGSNEPFVMELPDYRLPRPKYVLKSATDRAKAFVKNAGTLILLSTIVIWFTSNYGFTDGGFGQVDMDKSILAGFGSLIGWIFKPLGWGTWQNAVATIAGLVAKENVVSTFGILYGVGEVAEDGWQIWENIRANFSQLSAYSFLAFNLLCAPCFAAIGAIKREMGSAKWTLFAVGYLTVFAYMVSLIIYQVGLLVRGGSFGLGSLGALISLLVMGVLILRPSRTK